MDDDKYDEMMSEREEKSDVATEFHEILINSQSSRVLHWCSNG